MSLKARLEGGLKEALRAGDRVALGAIRLSLADVKNAEIERRRPLDDAEIVQLLRSGIKKRQEAIAIYRQGSRDDLVAKETAEMHTLEAYLPASLDAAELEALVAAAVAEAGAASPRDMGKVMKLLVPRVAGRADGAEVSRLVKERLASS